MAPNGRMNGFTDSEELNGLTMYDTDGDKIGSVEQVYVDDRSGRPEWVTVKTGMFGGKESFVPLAGAQRQGGDLHVPYQKELVKEAPRLDADQHLDVQQERDLYRHYGIGTGGAETRQTADAGGGMPGTTGAPSGQGAGGGMAGAGAGAGGLVGAGAGGMRERTGDTGEDAEGEKAAAARGGPGAGAPADRDSLVLSEEHVHVGKEEHEVGHARLHKYVVTENVNTPVELSHEEVRLVREPISESDRTRATSPMGEADVEVTLHEDQPTVSKESVPVERVRLDTERVTEQREVSTEARKEQVEYDDGKSGRTPGAEGGGRGRER